MESIAVVAVTRFVDKLLEEQGGDLLREGIRALRAERPGWVSSFAMEFY
jgi:hypothetical protein